VLVQALTHGNEVCGPSRSTGSWRRAFVRGAAGEGRPARL